MNYFSAYLTRKIAERGLKTQQELADLLDEPRENVNRWLNGTIPKPEKVERVVQVLGGPLIAGMLMKDGTKDSARLREENEELKRRLRDLEAQLDAIRRAAAAPPAPAKKAR